MKNFLMIKNLSHFEQSEGSQKFMRFFGFHPQNDKKGFTLAEVMIVLAIIGVVATITFTSLIQNIKNTKNISILKKAYSDLQNYVNQFAYDNDCVGNLSICSSCSTYASFVNDFTGYLINKKNFKLLYGNNSRVINNKIRPQYLRPYQFNGLGANSGYPLISPNKSYVLIISPMPYEGGYSTNSGDKLRAMINIWTKPSIALKHNSMYVGVDSRLKPGKNVFVAFIVDSTRVIPNGSPNCRSNNPADNYCKPLKSVPCSDDNAYNTCFQKIIDDGWKIKY